MSTTTVTQEEEALKAFLENLPEAARLQARTLAHAWASGGGTIEPGKVATRLRCGDPAFTAGTLNAPRGGQVRARLELCRVLLEKHGVQPEAFQHWSDEFADLAHHGFEPSAKYPQLPLGDHLGAGELARMASGMRDLARMTGPTDS